PGERVFEVQPETRRAFEMALASPGRSFGFDGWIYARDRHRVDLHATVVWSHASSVWLVEAEISPTEYWRAAGGEPQFRAPWDRLHLQASVARRDRAIAEEKAPQLSEMESRLEQLQREVEALPPREAKPPKPRQLRKDLGHMIVYPDGAELRA